MSIYTEAYNTWVTDQSPENMARLVNVFMPTLNSEIQRYEGSKQMLRSRGKSIVVNAVRTYNPMSGANLNSWVVTNLKQLSRYGKSLRDVRAPEEKIRRAAEINRVYSELELDLGRPPTDEELADEIGISVKHVSEARKSAVASVNSGTFNQESDNSTLSDPGVFTPSAVPFASEAVYRSLGDRDRKIFDMRTGSHGSKVYPASEIAKRFGISDAAVSQRASYIGDQIAGLASN